MRTNDLINVIFIGCGRISKKHFDAISELGEDGVKLRVVSDLDLTKCEQYTYENKIVSTNNFNDKNILKSVDLAVILTESGNHYEHAKFALKAGLDVLVEKPVTLKLEDAYELQKLAALLGRKFYVVKQNRFNEPILKAKQFVDRGYLGRKQISTVQVRWCRPQDYYDLADWRGTWAMDGGVISNQASHHVDLMRWFMGPVKSVQAIDRRFGVDIETEDTIIALIEFSSGAVGTLEATTSTRPRNLEGSFSIQGSKGAFEVGGFAVNEMRYIESKESDTFAENISEKSLKTIETSDVYGTGHKSIYKEILRDRLGEANQAVTISDAIETLELIHMIYRSVETGKKIINDGSDIKSMRMGQSDA
jgi:UDP-N-acetyl-2-amino-2-deoxyglucuronate dehydrogenase